MTLLLRQSAIFLIYLLLQVLIFNNFVLFDLATPHVFVLFLVMIPLNVRFPLAITTAFLAGLLLDLCSVDLFRGVHAFSAVLVVALREFWVNAITNRVTYRGSEEYLLQVQPAPWYFQYLFPLILVYELTYHLLEAFSTAHLGQTMLKIGLSSLYTFAICIIFTFLFHRSSKR
ncbi:MAG: rod shape-determining protein MreD [Bacteroidota bacterium]